MTNGLTAKAFSVLAHSTLKGGAMSKFWQQFEQHKRVVRGDIVETKFPYLPQNVLVRPLRPCERLHRYASIMQSPYCLADAAGRRAERILQRQVSSYVYLYLAYALPPRRLHAVKGIFEELVGLGH